MGDDESAEQRLLEENKESSHFSSIISADIQQTDTIDPKIENSHSECLKESNVDDDNEFNDLFEKYNLQISAIQPPEQEAMSTEFTDLIGTEFKPRFKKKEESTVLNE